MVSTVLLITSFICAVVGKPVTRSLQVHEARAVPPQFQLSGPASPDTILNLRLALVQSDPVGLQNTLLEVSDPSSASYGQWLSKEDVEKLVSPSAESVDAVTTWLQENGLTASNLSPAGDWLSISVPASKANELLNADFSVFEHTETGAHTIRTLQYSIPAGFESHIDLIHPTVQFPVKITGPQSVSPQPSSTDTTRASCASTVTPKCIEDLYGVPSTPAKDKRNVLGVSAFEEEWANVADLQQFLKTFRPDLPSSQTFTVLSVDDGINSQDREEAGVEANLDIQYTMGIASLVPTTFVTVGFDNNDGIDGFLDEILFLTNQTAPPQVLTTSYGFDEDTVTGSLAINLCNAYAQLGARGVSVLFASGDGGVSGGHSKSCTTFLPVFPASCPFLTSVGGTTGIAPETAADFSSGGFSNYFTIPSYQAKDVNTYIASLGDTYAGLYNRSGRGFPDVSAQSINFSVVLDAEVISVDGTSCASPTFASVVSLLNDGRLSEGKPPLGFLNPLLYANPSVLTDITSGSNPGCGTNGFNATKGWDPITGLGTPRFAALERLVGA
ncbi:family S53 protease [Obba rivulosa]|uniref:tripeptidyl-peptidase II n=1 Tax=Obba rivulosa TaxID=1052685 RepID=A0A8E2DJV0_9APHY|nr:family S53 protease [Obba rivulosa]